MKQKMSKLCFGLVASAVLLTVNPAAFAQDKVQGLALTKLSNLATLGPVGVAALRGPWSLLLAPVPSAWVGWLVLGDGSGPPTPVIWMVGLGLHLALLLWLLRRLEARLD